MDRPELGPGRTTAAVQCDDASDRDDADQTCRDCGDDTRGGRGGHGAGHDRGLPGGVHVQMEGWQADGGVREQEPDGHTRRHGRGHAGAGHVRQRVGRAVARPLPHGRAVQPAEDLHGPVPDHVRGRRGVPRAVQPGRAGPVGQQYRRGADQVVRRLPAADEAGAQRQRDDGRADRGVQAARVPDGARP